jgi:hypothetical protein
MPSVPLSPDQTQPHRSDMTIYDHVHNRLHALRGLLIILAACDLEQCNLEKLPSALEHLQWMADDALAALSEWTPKGGAQ